MFDVNPDSAKYYFRNLERQVAASRQPRGIPCRPEQGTPMKTRWESLVASYGRLLGRVLASVVRVVVTAIF